METLYSHPEQLSFGGLSEMEDHSTQLALIPYTDYHLINPKKFSFPQRRFFILSVLVHLGLAFYALTIVVEKLKKPEVIEVSYQSPQTMTAMAPAPTQASFNQPEPPAVIDPEPAPAVVAAPAKTHAHIPTRATPRPMVNHNFKVEPLATLSDIEVPDLTAPSEGVMAKLSLKEIESDFDKIDRTHNEKLLAAAKDDSKMLDDSIADLDETSKSLADEHSEIENLAAERLRNLQEQKSQLKKAATASAGPAVTKTTHLGAVNKSGSEDQQEAEASSAESNGIGSQSQGLVRRLEDLRQRPGNPRPDYDVNDRMNGLSGTIVVNAYVTKEGSLTMFRLIQSTGHRNLDRKTLSALKNWKFYPGQEGWVELPFKWDLKGGVQQKPTLLKRR